MRIVDTGSRIDERGAGIEKIRAENPRTTPLNPQSLLLEPAIHFVGLAEYQNTWDAMKQFTAQRTHDTRDEIWMLQHPPVYTQGLAGKPEHLLRANDIPVVKIDRGGQITYHGPGQIIAYLLLDLRQTSLLKPP